MTRCQPLSSQVNKHVDFISFLLRVKLVAAHAPHVADSISDQSLSRKRRSFELQALAAAFRSLGCLTSELH